MKSGGYTAFNASNGRWTLRKLAQRVNPNPFLDCFSLPCYPRANEEEEEEEAVDEKVARVEKDFRGPKIERMEMRGGGEYSEEDPLTRNEIAITPVDDSFPTEEEGGNHNYNCGGSKESSNGDGGAFLLSSPSSVPSLGVKRVVLSKTERRRNGKKESEPRAEIFSKCVVDARSVSLEKEEEEEELFPKCRARGQRSWNDSSEDGTS